MTNPLAWLDNAILADLNVLSRKSWVFDHAVAFVSANDLLKGGVLMVLVWWAWFRSDDEGSRDREHIIATVLSCVVALAIGRMLVLALPFRLRPLHEIGLGFVTPYGVDDTILAKLSSFPSDHAVLFFGLAAGLFFISRRIGSVALAYTIAAVALPRMYLGLHYFTDILAGAVIGIAVVYAGNLWLPGKRPLQRLQALSWSRPMYFYPVLFLVTYQIADLFEGSRAIVGSVFKLVRVT